MARIRTIKPDFWTNGKILTIKPLTRLLFIGLWNFSDDYGRMDYSPLSIKAKIFPNDDLSAADVRDMLNELSGADLLMIYSAKDKEYIEITGWDHQRIDKRQPSKIPGPFEDISVIRGIPPTSPDEPRLTTTPVPVMEGNGGEGKEDTREVALSDGWPSDYEKIFWAEWPNKVSKPVAMKALKGARKRRVSFAEILAGIQHYIRDKPPDREWMNPATYINGNRWEDQPAKVQNGQTGSKIIQAADDLRRKIASFDGPPSGDIGIRDGQGQAPPRLLSHG